MPLKKFNWQVKRRREIEKLARYVGAADTDDLSRYLVAWVWDNPRSKDQVGAVIECARRIGRKGFTEAEAREVIEEAGPPKARKADDLARYLRLNYATRQLLGITMIGAHDADKRERKRRRKERDKQAKEIKRRAMGAKLRVEYEANSISRAKPWKVEGISRAKWYRRQKAMVPSGTSPSTAEEMANCGETVERETSPSTAVLLYAVDTPVSPNKERLKRQSGGVGENCANQRRASRRLRVARH